MVWTLIGGVAFIVFGVLVQTQLRHLRARARAVEQMWRKVPATIISSHVRRHDSTDPMFGDGSPRKPGVEFSLAGNGTDIRYVPRIRYQYTVGGVTHESSRVTLTSAYGRKQAERLVAENPPGARTEAWVNPFDPEDAILSPEYTTREVQSVVWVVWAMYAAAVVFLVVAWGSSIGFGG